MRRRLDAIRCWCEINRALLVVLALMVLIPALFGGKTMLSAIMGY